MTGDTRGWVLVDGGEERRSRGDHGEKRRGRGGNGLMRQETEGAMADHIVR